MLLQLLFTWLVQDIMSGVEDTSEQTMLSQKEEVYIHFQILTSFTESRLIVFWKYMPNLNWYFGKII